MKKSKKVKNILYLLLILLTISIMNCNIVQASDVGGIISGGKDFVSTGEGHSASAIDDASIKKASNMIYNVLLSVGIVIAVAIASYLGIKYMTGGIEEQVKIKESMLPFLAGCIIIFGAFTIWKIVVLMTQGF